MHSRHNTHPCYSAAWDHSIHECACASAVFCLAVEFLHLYNVPVGSVLTCCLLGLGLVQGTALAAVLAGKLAGHMQDKRGWNALQTRTLCQDIATIGKPPSSSSVLSR